MRTAITLLSALLLAGCSASGSKNFQAGLLRFQSNVEAVNMAIAKISPQLAMHCEKLEKVGKELSVAEFVDNNSKAGEGLRAANAAIRSWCQAPPSDIASATIAMIRAVSAAKAATKK